MECSVALPQEANFSLNGGLGNGPFADGMAERARDSGFRAHGRPAKPRRGRRDEWDGRRDRPYGLLTGWTICCSTRARRPGRAPARSSMATLLASSMVKLPEIW